MSRKFLTPIDLTKLELQNARVQNLASPPAAVLADKGLLYFNSSDNTLYWWDGAQWIAAKAAAGATPAATVTTQAVGDAGVVGVSTNFAREDHKHGREAFGASTSVTTFGAAKSDGSAVTLARSDHTHGTPAHDSTAHSAIPLSALSAATAAINMGGFVVNNVGTPVAASDAANKTYVDNAVAGLSWKQAVRVASTAQVALTGLTAIDGVTPIATNRILLKNQTAPAENGIWVAAAGAWARATDADSAAELDGAAVYVEEGTTQADSAWSQTTNLPITLGTTAIAWVQFAGGGAVTAGAGMTQSGNTLNVIATDATLVVAADSIGRAALTGDVTTTINAATIATGVVSNAKLATMAANTIKMNNTAGVASPTDVTIAAAQTALGIQTQAATDALYNKTFAVDCAAALNTTVTHNFNTRDVRVDVYRTTTPWDTVDADVERTTVNAVDVRFAVAPTAAQYRIVVQGVDQ